MSRQRQVALLRGINLGPSRRISMPELRRRLEEAGYVSPVTHLQSGNIVLGSELAAGALARRLEDDLARWFGYGVPVVTRTAGELAAVVAADPLGAVATERKRYAVSFLSNPLGEAAAERLRSQVAEPEALAIHGREIYSWHPKGMARSKLWNALSSGRLGVTATMRNWSTVCALAELASS